MRQRPLGQTGLEVSELALGTWGLSGDGYGPVDEREQDAVIRRAQALGVTLFETADTYGRGSMEKRLGALLSGEPGVHFATKLGTDLDGSPPCKRFDADFLKQACERSADRLRRGVLDLVLLHNPAASTVRAGEATGVLQELHRAGAVRAWGVSAGSGEVAAAAIAHGAPVVQLAYNPFLRADLEGLGLDGSGPGVLVRSVLAHGLLAGQWSSGKTFRRADHRSQRWTEDQLAQRLRQLAALTCLLGAGVETPRAAALRFALTPTAVSAAVIGPRSETQLDQLVREATKAPVRLSTAQLATLQAELARHGVRP